MSEKTDSEKLELLADWFDGIDEQTNPNASKDVQTDLRRMAKELEDKQKSVDDPVVEQNVDFLRTRSEVGLKKYGVGLDRTDLKLLEWLQHFREELADALNYATVLQNKIAGEDNKLYDK